VCVCVAFVEQQSLSYGRLEIHTSLLNISGKNPDNVIVLSG
jgi:hypothetical protein